MNSFFAFLFGLTVILAFLFFFKNNMLRSNIQNYVDRQIVPKQNAFLTSIFRGFLNVTAGDMGNVIYKGIGIFLGVAALFFLAKALRMNISS